MKRLIFILLPAFLFSCHSSTNNVFKIDTARGDSIPFGTVQRLLEHHSPGERILRIDSLVEYQRRSDPHTITTIYYVTDKGTRQFSHIGAFRPLIIKGYKTNGTDDCFHAIVNGVADVTKCDDPPCTIVVDTEYIARKIRPYPRPNWDTSKLCVPCQ